MSLPYNLTFPGPADGNHLLIATAMYEASMSGTITDWSIASAGVQLRCKQSYGTSVATVSAAMTIGQASATLTNPGTLPAPPAGTNWVMETSAGDIRTLSIAGSTISWSPGLTANATATLFDLYILQIAPTKGITSVRLPFAQHFSWGLAADVPVTLTLGTVMTGVGNSGSIWNTTLQGELIKR